MSYGHAEKLEAKLKAEVAELMKRAEAANARDLPDGMNLPEELSRRTPIKSTSPTRTRASCR